MLRGINGPEKILRQHTIKIINNRERRVIVGMYHKNRLAGMKFKRFFKRQTSKGMRRAAKKSCNENFTDKVTLNRKSKNKHGMDSWLFS